MTFLKWGGSAPPGVPPVPKILPPVLPPITGGSTLKSQNLAPPHFRGEPPKFSEGNSPRYSPPFPGGALKNPRIPPGYPQNFLRASREKKCLKTRFTLENRKIFLCASREKGTKNLNLPLKTVKIFFALRAKNAKISFLPSKK